MAALGILCFQQCRLKSFELIPTGNVVEAVKDASGQAPQVTAEIALADASLAVPRT